MASRITAKIVDEVHDLRLRYKQQMFFFLSMSASMTVEIKLIYLQSRRIFKIFQTELCQLFPCRVRFLMQYWTGRGSFATYLRTYKITDDNRRGECEEFVAQTPL